MPECKGCGDDVDELVKVKVEGKVQKLCEDCADRAREEAEIGAGAEGAMKDMMGYKGKG